MAKEAFWGEKKKERKLNSFLCEQINNWLHAEIACVKNVFLLAAVLYKPTKFFAKVHAIHPLLFACLPRPDSLSSALPLCLSVRKYWTKEIFWYCISWYCQVPPKNNKAFNPLQLFMLFESLISDEAGNFSVVWTLMFLPQL